MHKIFIILTALIFNVLTVFSQDVGSFDKTIDFNNEQRTISFFVPTDYDDQNEYYLIIGLHGLGDNSANFRTALIQYLNWDYIFPNTIFAFPDGGNEQIRDFYTPAGDEQIIIETINYCKNNYNIDESHIIIEGFSLGGRSALKFALDNPDLFYGVILNTPAIQGKLDAMNSPDMNFGFNYQNASKLKIAISYGEEDIIYHYPINTMYDSLNANNGITMMQQVSGMGHSVATQNYIEKLKNFIDNPTPNQYDIEILDLDYTNSHCSQNTTLNINFRNIGSEDISKLTFQITDGNQTIEKEWSGNLPSFQFAEESFDFDLFNEGKNDLELIINAVDNDNNILAADTGKFEMWYYPDGVPTPFLQDFESEEILSKDWEIIHGAAPLPFFPDNGYKSQNSLSCFNSILLFNSLNTREELITPPINLSNISQPTLYFDYSFNYQLYTPPYFTQNVIFTDTLEIYFSTDCGSTWKRIYKKWGSDLATWDTPITNPLEINQLFPDNSNNWKKEVIDMSNYQNSQNLKIKFSYISGLGGTIYLDNISIDEFTNVKEDNENLSFYPNPAQDYIIINLANRQFNKIQIINSLGQIVINKEINNYSPHLKLNLQELNAGYYLVKLIKNSYVKTFDFIKE